MQWQCFKGSLIETAADGHSIWLGVKRVEGGGGRRGSSSGAGSSDRSSSRGGLFSGRGADGRPIWLPLIESARVCIAYLSVNVRLPAHTCRDCRLIFVC
jgi:hypothetical protein